MLSSLSNTYNTLDKLLFLFLYFKYLKAIAFSFEKDKNDFEKTIEAGKFGSLLFKYFLIAFISSLDILAPLNNTLFVAKGNDCNLVPSYNVWIKDKWFVFSFNPKSLLISL